MQLCDKDIINAIRTGDLVFAGTNPAYPFKKEQIQPASVDLRLGSRVIRFKKDLQSFDIKDIKKIEQNLDVEYAKDGQKIKISPGEILFGQIYEQIVIGNNFSARIEGRSRVARLGLSVHCTGDYINPGFAGAMPLQIINHNHFPIYLYPYIGICQLIVYELTDIPLISYLQRSVLPYNTYYNETNPSPSILSSDPEDGLHSETIIEKKIKLLIENFYNIQANESLEKHTDSVTSQILINNAIINNLEMGGYNLMRDQYNAKQVGNQGPNSGENSKVTQIFIEEIDIDSPKLIEELNHIKSYLQNLPQSDENIILMGDITKATHALKEDKKSNALSILKMCGSKLYDIAKTIGCAILARFLATALGIP